MTRTVWLVGALALAAVIVASVLAWGGSDSGEANDNRDQADAATSTEVPERIQSEPVSHVSPIPGLPNFVCPAGEQLITASFLLMDEPGGPTAPEEAVHVFLQRRRIGVEEALESVVLAETHTVLVRRTTGGIDFAVSAINAGDSYAVDAYAACEGLLPKATP